MTTCNASGQHDGGRTPLSVLPPCTVRPVRTSHTTADTACRPDRWGGPSLPSPRCSDARHTSLAAEAVCTSVGNDRSARPPLQNRVRGAGSRDTERAIAPTQRLEPWIPHRAARIARQGLASSPATPHAHGSPCDVGPNRRAGAATRRPAQSPGRRASLSSVSSDIDADRPLHGPGPCHSKRRSHLQQWGEAVQGM